ncbi:MAG: DNA polymerase III subunit delta' [Candidatus Limimorpha sp.]|nr:DNA polymerase III subunit delta' [Bacteroidales bacterium]MDY6075028.1 DNA polymerase III subunit delta' [Bacteroidales bacterium]
MLFSEIVGHDDLKKRLIQSVNENRVAHAQLFVGTEGSGKMALAIAYAQYINCQNRTESDSCGVCPSCKKYMSLSHPDLHFIFPTATNKSVKKDPESDLFLAEWREYFSDCQGYVNLSEWFDKLDIENKQGIINVRDASTVIRKLSFKSYESEYKVVILWMPEKLNVFSANKLLKLIEEPPEKTLFLLVAENQEEVLSTIRSRCVLVKVPRLDTAVIKDALVEKCGCSEQLALDAATMSNGSWPLAKRFSNDIDNEMLYADTFRKWMRYCFKGAVPELIDFVANEIKGLGREKQKALLEYGLNIFHCSLLINNNISSAVMLTSAEKTFAQNFAPYINMKNVTQICALFEESINQIVRNANAQLVFMDDSLKMSKLLRLR